ncbi:CRISPR-associated endoribonuclease [Neptunitalea chrysea]|uniref:CRISPR-associated endoribonuclease n=1 Tax=Neptunitalea chrysea TaxID=1647581 RepID=A0A9W6EV14_9FLAO|nr:CRISPR-associated endoribonuclease Cas6 [Neptunitalea chrysea]GLB54170.1 CRISPR-associated endoribonuclease [Neptunitalea chrysea]
MLLKITLEGEPLQRLPLNYQYPLSAAIYRILWKGNTTYAQFLHEEGYGKGFKFFTFSQIHCPFSITGNRMVLQGGTLYFYVAFHLPQAMENFVKGLFKSEAITIADKQSKGVFTIKSVESVPSPLVKHTENELVSINVIPDAAVVAGIKNEKGNYNFLMPDAPEFIAQLVHNWREKIITCYDAVTGSGALLLIELKHADKAKSRLITIKADTDAETKIRGWLNYELQLTAEKRFVELLLNAGAGLYNAQGFGFLNVIDNKK